MSEVAPGADDYTPVSVEDADGRILSGVGITEDALRETMGDREPAEAPPEPTPAGATPASAPPEKQTRGQKRYAELTFEREEARRERDELKAQIAALQTRPAPGAPPPAQEPTPPSTPPAAAPTPARFTFPTYDQAVATHPALAWEDWLDARQNALTDHKIAALDLDASIRARVEADQASRTLADKFTSARALAAERYPDFHAVTQTATHLTRPDWPMDRLQTIGGLEPAAHAHVLYALAKDPALSDRLRTVDPLTFGWELARLIPSAGVAPTASTSPPAFVPPPQPYQPVGGSSKTTARTLDDLAAAGTDDYDRSGWREKRRSDREGGRRR